MVKELLILRAANVIKAAIARVDAGDVAGAIQRLMDFLAIPDLAVGTDP